MAKKLEPGQTFYDEGSGVVVVVLRGGEATLSTEHGAMKPKAIDVSSENLDVVDADLSNLGENAMKDSPDRM